MLSSMVCRYADFSQAWYKAKECELRIREIYRGHSATEVDFVGRKFWEWCAIAQALDERAMLRPGRSGLGFAVGTEPLASFFASRGCRILASDLNPKESNTGWIERNEHAACLDAVYHHQLLDRREFDRLVDFQYADMRTLQGLSGTYDFVWSSCALEHLGSLQAGLDFVLASASLLRPGGVAVHTTEFNVRSNVDTLETGDNVIYRQRDILALSESLKKQGMTLATPNFDCGDHQFDIDFDRPPYFSSGKPHIKLELGGHVCTSFMLIVEKSESKVSRKHSPLETLRRLGSRFIAAHPPR
ncbi:MAG TPA: methyltransferase domain-containing protein [Noviherbaspirillum sp.]|uniref:class I SAM-dependent methyltransferase n=1 Tax=Noviherbaspirillum sp. TaxID=1926288 RepID=UPI002D6C4B79|nr:methyltransferase domain-containing protein [Noviherbaspirillum sp.]HYD95307.1 methyltransferase domain-containing protein [Noviherbaspirillum sp.]